MAMAQTTSNQAPTIWWDERGEVYNAERLFPAIQSSHSNPGRRRGLTTGWSLFDEFFTLKKKQLTVVSGIPNHGKSEFMDALIVNSIVDHQWKWGIFSPENYPYEDHFEKLAEKFCECPFHFIAADKLAGVATRINPYIFWTYPRQATISSLMEIWKKLVIDERVDAVLLDPWNTIEHKRPSAQSETEYIGEALSLWIDFARTMDVEVFIVAHPTKIPINRETGLPYLMSGYDISGSANWVNKPDNILIIQRPDFSKSIAHVHVQKIRDQRHTGKRGAVKFEYVAELGGQYRAIDVLR